MPKTIEQLANEIEALRVAGVENKMFFGMREICALVFRNKVRLDLLRRWVEFADFPAPHLPKGKAKTRVTTWGLVEAWLMVIHEAEHIPGIERIAHSDTSLRQRRAVIKMLQRLHSGDRIDETIKQIEAKAEERLQAKIRRETDLFEKWLQKEVGDFVEEKGAGGFGLTPREARKAVRNARSAKGIKPRPLHGRS